MTERNPSDKALFRLWDTVVAFVEEHEITCPESIYQRDNMYELSPQLLEALCDEVGYFEFEDEDDS